MDDIRLKINGLEIFVVPYLDNFIAYSPLNGVALLLNDQAVDEILHYYSKDNQVQSHFLDDFLSTINSKKPIDLIESYEYNDSTEIKFRPSLIGLALTTECNLSCVYCHANAGEYRDILDFDVAKIVLETVHNNAVEVKEPFDVSYAGFGEPTLQWD